MRIDRTPPQTECKPVQEPSEERGQEQGANKDKNVYESCHLSNISLRYCRSSPTIYQMVSALSHTKNIISNSFPPFLRISPEQTENPFDESRLLEPACPPWLAVVPQMRDEGGTPVSAAVGTPRLHHAVESFRKS
jgi:hypothetical protein